MLRKKKNSIALLIAAAMGCSGLFDLKAEEFSNNVWFNVDAFEKESKAQQQQSRALWNLPTARTARMALMEQQHRQVEKLTAFMLEHTDRKDEKISPLAAYEKAWNDVYAAARRDAKRALESEAVQQLLDAADDLDEEQWLASMTPELVRGLIYALEEQYDCFDFRNDGRDARRAHLLGLALAKEGWTQGMDDAAYKQAQQKEVLQHAAFLMNNVGMGGSDAFKAAWHQTHASSSISSFHRVVGPVVWSGPGTPADLSDLDPEYVKKMVEEAKKIVAATKAVASAYQQSRHGAAGASAAPSPVAPPSHGGAAGGGAVGGGGGGGGSVGGSAAKPVDYSAIFRLLATATPETPAPVDVDEAPGGNVVWNGKVANLKDGVSETFNKYQATPVLDVTLSSVWRPWEITVDDTDITMSTHSPTGQAAPLGAVGYAFNGTGSIGDYVDEDGTVHKTTLTKKGNGILVLANVGNSYSGGTDVQGGTLYVADQGALGTGTVTMHENTSMWVNYTWNRDYTSSFRNPVVSNGINLANGASATVSYGAFPYQKVLNNDTSRIWRNLYMTGGLSGDAGSSLFLQGYTSHGSSSDIDFEVPQLHLGGNPKMRGELWYSGFILNRSEALTKDDRFEGTLTLGNRTNISKEDQDRLIKRETGAVKLVLSDDVLEHATLDATREWAWVEDKPDATITAQNKLMLEGKIGDKTVEGYTVSVSDAIKNAYAANSSLHQTNSHTILISDNTKVGELKAELLGVTQDTYRDFADWSEGLEVQYVRVATMEDNATLTLGKEKSSASSWFSGTVGFKDLLCDANGDGKDDLTEANMTGLKLAGSGATKEGLSLVKVGDNAQYIHSAVLHNLDVQGGTLGFNQVELDGNLQLRSDSKLRVGVNEGHWTTAADTSLEIGEWEGTSHHRLTVLTEDAKEMVSPITGEKKPVPLAARVEGQLTMHAGTELEFLVENLGQDTGDRKVIIPVGISSGTDLSTVGETGITYLKEHSLLQVAGTTGVKDAEGNAADVKGVLTLSQNVAVSLTGVNFLREDYNGRTYFLASADKIIVDGESVAQGHASDFASRIVTLGYGFYGIISSIDGHGYYSDGVYQEYTGSSYLDQDFLVLKVAADPTRSWTGSTVARGVQGSDKQGAELAPWLGSANTWKALPGIEDYTDYKNSDYYELTDPQWKENGVYTDGVSVKFGNLYMPEAWADFKAKNPKATLEQFTEHLTSSEVTKADASQQIFSPNGHGNGIAMRNETGDILYGVDGSAYFNEDGTKFVTPDGMSAHYEHVMIDGTVRPGYVTVNSDYTLRTADGYVTMTDDTNYVFTDYKDDEGNVRKGCIADATAADMEGIYTGLLGKDLDAGVMSDLADWHTGLAKGGTGALVIETENTYSGGSLLRGGLTVMRNKWALGMADPTKLFTDKTAKGGKIEMAYGAALMVDYIDSDYNAENVIAQGQLTNDLTITHMADYDNTKATGDAQLMNRYDAALVVNTLTSYDDAILTLRGASLEEGALIKKDSKGQEHSFYSYADYVITNPVNAYGTIRMAGYLQGSAGRVLTDDGSAYKYGGGNVQLTISGHDSAEKNPKILWDHTTVDLSLNGGNKNVLAIETRFLHNGDGTVTENDGTHTIQLTLGTLKDDGMSGANACVINDASSERIGSKNKTSYLASLTLNPAADATFSGNVGFGIGQNAEGAAMPSRGYISLTKTGAAAQSIGNARLLDLTVQGAGMLHVNGSLSARSITTTDVGAQHIHVGAVEDASMSHTLTVGKGGVLSFDTTLGSTLAANDPLAGLKGTESMEKYGSELSYVLLKDGATLTGSGNWYTQKGIAVVGGANITFNTHDYSMDPTVSSSMEIYGESAQLLKDAFTDSHIFWMTQSLAGADVTLNLVNEQMSVGATEAERGTATSNGYVITRDLNSYVSSKNSSLYFGLQGNSVVNIGAKTIMQSYQSATTNSGIVYNITGTDAALQFLDAKSSMLDASAGYDSYVKNATLADGGRLIFGGASAANATTNKDGNTDSLDKDITADADVVISQRKAGQTATVTNVAHTTKNVTENGVTYETNISGNTSARAQIQHAEMTVKKESDVNNTRVQKADVVDTLVSLQEKCSVSLENVLVTADSKIEGAGPLDGKKGAAALTNGATEASNQLVAVDVTVPSFSTGSVTMTDADTRINVSLTKVETIKVGNGLIQVNTADQLSKTDVGGKGLTLGLTKETLEKAGEAGVRIIAIQVSDSGRFLYEQEGSLGNVTLTDHNGKVYAAGDIKSIDPNFVVKVVSSEYVAQVLGVAPSQVSNTLLYIEVPEPATALLSLFALAGMAARRRRK